MSGIRREDIFNGVAESLAGILDVDISTVKEESRIIDDLGADSLDLLELTFHLQQKFGITISPRDMERRTREKLGGKPLEVDGVYTPEAIAELRKAMPEVPPEELPDGLHTAALPRRFRVTTMVNMVSLLLEEKGE